jgi:hypothetical protein
MKEEEAKKEKIKKSLRELKELAREMASGSEKSPLRAAG